MGDGGLGMVVFVWRWLRFFFSVFIAMRVIVFDYSHAVVVGHARRVTDEGLDNDYEKLTRLCRLSFPRADPCPNCSLKKSTCICVKRRFFAVCRKQAHFEVIDREFPSTSTKKHFGLCPSRSIISFLT